MALFRHTLLNFLIAVATLANKKIVVELIEECVLVYHPELLLDFQQCAPHTKMSWDGPEFTIISRIKRHQQEEVFNVSDLSEDRHHSEWVKMT
jgi:hypothetical protein